MFHNLEKLSVSAAKVHRPKNRELYPLFQKKNQEIFE